MEKLTNPDRQNLSDLINKLGNEEQGSTKWEFLWSQFDYNVSVYLWKICRNNSEVSDNFDEEEIKDLISVSKQKIYANLKKLKFPVDSTAKDRNQIIKSWMGTILKNQTRDIIKQSESLKNFLITSDETIEESAAAPETDDNELSPRSRKMLDQIEEALKSLSTRDREVFETYAYNRHSNGKIDDYLLQNLNKKYKLTEGYSSKLYKRSIEKIKKIINNHNNGKASQTDTGDDEASG